MIFNKAMLRHGIIFVKDIIKLNTGSFLSYAELLSKYGNCITQYDYICLRDAIPLNWRDKLRRTPLTPVDPLQETLYCKLNFNEIKPIKLVRSKNFYMYLISQQTVEPTCKKSWFEKYFIDFSDIEWRNIFTLARKLTCDTKLLVMQFKIIHRVYATPSYVSNFDMTRLCSMHKSKAVLDLFRDKTNHK